MGAAEPRPGPAPEAAGAQPALLLVDDDDDVARVFSRAFEQSGFDVRRMRSGGEAVAVARGSQRFASAVVDLVLPGVGGLEVVRALRSSQPGCRIVGVSGVSQVGLEAAFRAAGADGFFTKPVDLPALLAAVRSPRPA